MTLVFSFYGIILSMNKYSFKYKIKSDKTICLYRIFSNTPHVHIPDMIDEKKVTEISDYCFSSKSYSLNDILSYGNDTDLYELGGDNIEYIYLPDTITKLGSFTFYNCKKLKEISLPFSLNEIGSDMFINAHNLHKITYRTPISKPTILKQILTQISWDIDIQFDDVTLFYSEYYEIYDEIGPAHIFGLNISGEGFRLRQCFQNGIVSLNEYDKTFEKLCIEESKKKLAHFVMYRFLDNPTFYKDYVFENQNFIASYVLEFNDMSDHMKLNIIQKMLEYNCLDSDTLDTLISLSTSKNMIEFTTIFLDLKKTHFTSKNKYDFEDF